MWVLFVHGTELSKTSCPFPPEFKNYYDFNWELRNNEWINTKSKTNYLLLSLSWSPTFCASLSDIARVKEFQCHRSDIFDFVVHGLWPQTFKAASVRDQPRNCRNEQQLPLSIIKRFYCLMPDEDLMQAEWEKHGKVPNIRAMKQPTSSSIKNAFLTLNSPHLFPSAIDVHIDKQGRLHEIRLCYDLQYKFISCTQ
ncbi:unnamed protein product [Rotaria sp. Silwood1]|nr:unnamed protein product [Rotaria sp. Silwood1]CAF1422715.1 unnamed protein product [Rotaria sp. Silwood1]CAF1423306.1 unnamed protein product [Rotaria sp. Silwood1]CAF3592892.1 unnamed protein product [Rotaria sp. Silwood1]CAF3616572.1 unnamed protein product [Rotaria sp. Silwood1]